MADIKIYGRLRNATTDQIIVSSDLVHDTELDMFQNEINAKNKNDFNLHLNDKSNPHSVTKDLVGLGNVTNDIQVKRADMGIAGGVATLNEQGLIPSTQLPSYVDDIIDCYAIYDKATDGTLSNIVLYKDPEHTELVIGESGKIYVDVTSASTRVNMLSNEDMRNTSTSAYQFRWTGTVFSVVGAPTVIGEITGTAYDGGKGKALSDAFNNHISDKSNPHGVNADQVLLTSDLTLTANVGVHTIGSSGSKVLPTTGKSVKQVMDMLFASEKNPSITQPSVNISSSNIGAKEVGTRLSPAYNATLSIGSYQYGPATGVSVISWNVIDTEGNTKDVSSGSFAELQVTDNTRYSITAVAQHTEGVIPFTNLGNPYPAGKINAGSKSRTSGILSGYRNSFYGTLDNKNELTSNTIRTLTKSNKALANGAKFDITIPLNAMRVVVAYPATLRNLTSVLDVNGLNAEIVSSFKSSTLDITGANEYNAISYKVFILDYAQPNDKQNTYKITI